jgi:spore germination cell wall hydrolase CwlJ-like protein
MISAMICVALNVYHEARNESLMSQVAHAQVVVQRVESERFPNSECEVVFDGGENELWRCQFSWYCDGKSDTPYNARAWRKARVIASLVLARKLWIPALEGALFYHADYVSPNWGYVQLAKIGRTIFYSQERES